MAETNRPLISVLIPVYNASEFLPACLDSLLAQTYDNFEAVMVDDGSADNSLDIMQSYAALDNRFKEYTQKNSGPSAARNTALANAKGEYIMKLDADDWVSPDYMESALRRMAEEDAQGAVSDMYLYVSETEQHRHTFRDLDFNTETITGAEGLVKSINWEDLHSCLILHKDVYRALTYDTSGTFGDEVTERRLISNCNRLAFSPGVYYYRYNQGSVTQKPSPRRFDLCRAYVQTKQLLEEKSAYELGRERLAHHMVNALTSVFYYYARHGSCFTLQERRQAMVKMKELFENIDTEALADEYRQKGLINSLVFKFKMSSWPAYKLVSWMLWPILKKNY